MEYSLEQQFYFAMLAQIRRYENCEKTELAEIFTKALELTVPNLERKGFMDRVLSLEEINLLLEKTYCNEEPLNKYEEILVYIEKMERTVLAMAKVYPKAVYYYYDAWKQSGDKTSAMTLRMLELCDKAIEILRDANRMFYLWELFCMREEIMPMLPEKAREDEAALERMQECLGWKETLEEIYQEYGVTIRMYEFCYLYVESENYCIGDVVRIRRKMLGMSQKKLCEDLCDERTLSRLENNKSKPQREVVRCLFDRLNLSTELCRTELVTESKEAIEKYKELRKQNNNRNYEAVEQLVAELKELINMEIPSNRQAVERIALYNQYVQGKIEKKDYITSMKIILGYTVPYTSAIKENEKYLTKEEITCMQNMTLGIDSTYRETEERIFALLRLGSSFKYSINYVRMYEFIMVAVAGHLGNTEDYDISNQLYDKVIIIALKNRRINAIDNAIYGIFWNYEQTANKEDNEEIRRNLKRIQQCIVLSKLCRKDFHTKFFIDKLNKM